MHATPPADLTNRVLARADELSAELVEIRRDLHANPELSWKEQRTSRRVLDRLTAAGLAPVAIGETGVLVDIGTNDGPVVARSLVAVVAGTGGCGRLDLSNAASERDLPPDRSAVASARGVGAACSAPRDCSAHGNSP